MHSLPALLIQLLATVLLWESVVVVGEAGTTEKREESDPVILVGETTDQYSIVFVGGNEKENAHFVVTTHGEKSTEDPWSRHRQKYDIQRGDNDSDWSADSDREQESSPQGDGDDGSNSIGSIGNIGHIGNPADDNIFTRTTSIKTKLFDSYVTRRPPSRKLLETTVNGGNGRILQSDGDSEESNENDESPQGDDSSSSSSIGNPESDNIFTRTTAIKAKLIGSYVTRQPPVGKVLEPNDGDGRMLQREDESADGDESSQGDDSSSSIGNPESDNIFTHTTAIKAKLIDSYVTRPPPLGKVLEPNDGDGRMLQSDDSDDSESSSSDSDSESSSSDSDDSESSSSDSESESESESSSSDSSSSDSSSSDSSSSDSSSSSYDSEDKRKRKRSKKNSSPKASKDSKRSKGSESSNNAVEQTTNDDLVDMGDSSSFYSPRSYYTPKTPKPRKGSKGTKTSKGGKAGKDTKSTKKYYSTLLSGLTSQRFVGGGLRGYNYYGYGYNYEEESSSSSESESESDSSDEKRLIRRFFQNGVLINVYGDSSDEISIDSDSHSHSDDEDHHHHQRQQPDNIFTPATWGKFQLYNSYIHRPYPYNRPRKTRRLKGGSRKDDAI